MNAGRILEWEGCFNVRDLGGLRTQSGGTTIRGAVVRADCLDRLTPAGWSALGTYGIRTVVDLRNDDELTSGLASRPPGVETLQVPIDGLEDEELWGRIRAERLDGSPLYYRPFLERKADRCAAAVAAIANARPGGVVFHCGLGRDRTGLIALLVLALVGVDAGDIAADYELSAEGVGRLEASRGGRDQAEEIARILRGKGTSARAEILDLLSSVDVRARLREGGLGDGDVEALRGRLVSPMGA